MDLKSIDVQGWLDWFATNKDAFDAIEVILGILGILLIAPIIWGIKQFLKWMRPPAPMPKEDSGADAPSPNQIDVSIGGDNSGIINTGDGTVIAAGENATIAVGYTIEKHEAILKSREAQLRADLNRASTAEKQVFQLQLTNVEKELADLTTSYEAAVQENARLKSELAAFAEYIPENEITRAQLALENGDRSTADAILKAAEERSQNVVRASARMAYLRGEIAEGEIRWQDALDHYKRAYDLDATLEHQKAYARLCWQMGRWEVALPLHKDILEQVAAEHGKAGKEYASALNNLALMYDKAGRYDDAEPLHDEALSITRRVLGADHPDTATSLNNLALLYKTQGRYEDAEPLYEEALSIRRRVLGADHPNTASSLNNLAALYRDQERYEDAEPLFEEALSICRRELGADHPDTATSLNNLAALYRAQGRYSEAAPLWKEAVEIVERVLGVEHPNTKVARGNYEGLLAEMKEEGAVVGSH